VSSLRKSLLLLALAVACKTYHAGDHSLPSVDDDGGPYPNPPSRQVLTEAGPIGTPGKSDGSRPTGAGGFGLGGGSGGTSGSGGPTDGSYRDAPSSGTGGSGGACSACSLIAQDCPNRSLGCYPSNGSACCAPAGAVPETGRCIEDSQCDRGLVCVDLICVSLCDTSAPASRCRACTPFGPYQGVGTCQL
jgi:hypothetical protein